MAVKYFLKTGFIFIPGITENKKMAPVTAEINAAKSKITFSYPKHQAVSQIIIVTSKDNPDKRNGRFITIVSMLQL